MVKQTFVFVPPSTLRIAPVSARSSRGLTFVSSVGGDLDHLAAGDEPVAIAVRDDDDGVGDDVTVLGAPRLDLEALADVLERDGVAIGIDVVDLELRGLGLVARRAAA